ncbi:MAG TPA: hypothetical protein VN947_17090 [Polyangia bacterium]|nr:hypothetical protein [Polyangia bacterium]
MRLIGLSLALPFLVAACGQSLKPFQGFDAGGVAEDMSAGGGGGGDGGGSTPVDLAGADFAGAVPDTDGPVITYVKPMAGVFVGQLLEVVVTVTDPSGVNPATVKAVIAHDPNNTLSLKPTGTADTYHAFFDTTTLSTLMSFLDIDVVADDKLGNHGELGEEVLVDDVPPWMTMNAKVQMRVGKEDSAAGKFECSQSFGPLGPTDIDPQFDNTPEAAYEGAVMKQAIGLRARIEDHGNHVPGQRVDYFSDIDETTVTLYAVGIVAPATTLPVLAVDTNGDGFCDDVNPALQPTSGMISMPDEALALHMTPLTDAGSPDFTTGGAVPAACGEVGTAMDMPPSPLCTKAGTGMTFVIPGFGKDKPIYSLPPVKDPDACVGFPLDAANHLPEGPACVITYAVDNAGNHMVSYPIHICVDLGNHKCDTFTVTDNTACTGKLVNGTVMPGSTCAPPPVNGTVVGTFPTDGSEIRDLDIFK